MFIRFGWKIRFGPEFRSLPTSAFEHQYLWPRSWLSKIQPVPQENEPAILVPFMKEGLWWKNEDVNKGLNFFVLQSWIAKLGELRKPFRKHCTSKVSWIAFKLCAHKGVPTHVLRQSVEFHFKNTAYGGFGGDFRGCSKIRFEICFKAWVALKLTIKKWSFT